MKNSQKRTIKHFREFMDNSEMGCYIRGVGVREKMRPSIVDRPSGTGDWLLMYFHDKVAIGSVAGRKICETGDWIIWSDSDSHYYGTTENPWMHSWIHVQGSAILPFVIDSGLKTNKVYHLDGYDVLYRSLCEIYDEITIHTPDTLILQNLFQNLLLRLSREVAPENKDQVMPEKILGIKNLLESHPGERYTIADLAKKASMSIPHFCAEYKKNVGVSPIEYHIRMRLQQARHLLYDLNLSISEIAERVGYNDIYHFSKQFKKHFGMSPSKLRK